MKIRVTNQLNMLGACIDLAFLPDYERVWRGKEPADFETDITLLQTGYAAVQQTAALCEGAAGGSTDAKADAEAKLENATFVLTRALVNHFRKTNNVANLAKVNLSRSAIVQLRNQLLVEKATSVRDLAVAAQAEPGAAGRGITAARVAEVTSAINAFSKVISSPRNEIVSRSTLLKEVETDVAALLEQLNDLDDLILQFDGTDEGKRFIEAWKRARIIIDLGGTHTTEAKPTMTTQTAAQK